MKWIDRQGLDLDDSLLDELLFESSRSAERVLSPQTAKMPRKRQMNKNTGAGYPLDAPSTVVRQALFPSGPGSYPSQIIPLQNSQPCKLKHQVNENSPLQFQNEHKWREMGWNTSFPAEYLQQISSKDFKQTLAYSEDLIQRQNLTDTSCGTRSPALKGGHYPRSTSFSSTTTTATTRGLAEIGSAQTEEERTLLKHTMLRENLLAKLHDLIKTSTPPQCLLQPHLPPREPLFNLSKGTEVLHLLLQLRDVGVLVLESILRWHELRVRLAPMVPLVPFRFENHNYCVKLLSDLTFLSTIKTLGAVLGVSPSTMKQNPFMMPTPIPDRDFREIRETPWRSLRLFVSEDPVQRVADAEKYLVWCLSNLQDPPVLALSSPVCSGYGNTSPSSSIRKCEPQEKQTWQKRAEQQLEMLSMPLESTTGLTYVQDSSKMMKRKGVLPSLPQSPSKTLRELMGNVHQGEKNLDDYGDDNNCVEILRTRWMDEEFTASVADFEALGTLESPPHQMVTLLAASVLILLSPADQLPKDLSWFSCQKMFRHGKSLMQRVNSFDVRGVPIFKWKALVPFLQDEHFQPTFLAQFSKAGSTLCAWVFSVVRTAQQQNNERQGLHTSDGLNGEGEEDRLELLLELEVDATASSTTTKDSPTVQEYVEKQGSVLPPLQSRSKKGVSSDTDVLFINENRAVSNISRSSSRSSARRSKSPAASNYFTIASLHSEKTSSALLQTSPWMYRGVVYFVSFFLQKEKKQEQQEESEERRLLIKIYEPMSSVESHMSMDMNELRQDFGDDALVAFQLGQYRSLCELMLRQLDRMMETESPQTSEMESQRSLVTADKNGSRRNRVSALDLLLQDSENDADPTYRSEHGS